MPTVADVIVTELRNAGVRTLFGVPGGGSNLDLIAAAGRINLPFVLTSTETAAAIAAVAQSEITGRVAACLTTLGPGAASVVNGVACAFLDRAPVVVFTDTYSASATYTHQRFDHAALFATITKSSDMLVPECALATVDRAISTAVAGRPGPVHLDCPGDVLGGAATARRPADAPGAVAPAPCPPEFDALLSRARKPLIIVGLGARHADDASAIRALCDRRNVPALVTYKAKGVVPDDHRWFGGVFTHAAIEQPLIDESDLLIGIGLDPVELLPRVWHRDQPIVYCGPWPVEDRHTPFAAQFVIDVTSGVKHIEGVLPASRWDRDRVREHLNEQRRRVVGAKANVLDGGANRLGQGVGGQEAHALQSVGLTAQRVVQIAAARLASVAGRVSVDAGAHMFPATMLWPVHEPTGMLISNGLSTMGFALPAAIGAALVDRERPVVALTGDGGLLMCVGELLTAAREGLRIITIVFNDSSLSLIEIKQQARRLEPAGVALGAIDWGALAESVGVSGFVASDDEELERAVEEALACDGPCLIEAKIDRSNYGEILRAVRG